MSRSQNSPASSSPIKHNPFFKRRGKFRDPDAIELQVRDLCLLVPRLSDKEIAERAGINLDRATRIRKAWGIKAAYRKRVKATGPPFNEDLILAWLGDWRHCRSCGRSWPRARMKALRLCRWCDQNRKELAALGEKPFPDYDGRPAKAY